MSTTMMQSQTAPVGADTANASCLQNPQSYTILRIKRKRTEEPLEALVVEAGARRKKSRGGVGVFQYAQTVEEDAWNDSARQKNIEDEIARLAQQTAREAQAKLAAPPPFQAPPSPVSNRKPRDERRYTIVQNVEEPTLPQRRYPAAPPKVYATKELEAQKDVTTDFKMYDAVPAATTAASPMDEDDEEMDKFLPMLNDYLKLHDTSSDSAPLKKPSSRTNGHVYDPPTNDINEPENEYVWDVFYHRPATSSEWNAVAANIGTISGLPPSFDGYDSASDSDEEFDEADEDSNAEEYYKNDYPEDEDDSGSSDEFHEESDYDDAMGYRDNAEQFNYR